MRYKTKKTSIFILSTLLIGSIILGFATRGFTNWDKDDMRDRFLNPTGSDEITDTEDLDEVDSEVSELEPEVEPLRLGFEMPTETIPEFNQHILLVLKEKPFIMSAQKYNYYENISIGFENRWLDEVAIGSNINLNFSFNSIKFDNTKNLAKFGFGSNELHVETPFTQELTEFKYNSVMISEKLVTGGVGRHQESSNLEFSLWVRINNDDLNWKKVNNTNLDNISQVFPGQSEDTPYQFAIVYSTNNKQNSAFLEAGFYLF